MNTKVKGYVLAAISAATYGMNPLFALPLYEGGMDLYSVLFFRYLFAIPILAVMLKMRRRDFSTERADIMPLIILGILFAMSSITLFSSYNHMDAGIASTILFVYPIIVALIMFIFFKEKISKKTMACIAVALFGIVLLCNSGEGAVVSTKGVLFVFASALSYSIYIVMVNKSRIKKMATIKLTMYVCIDSRLVYFCCKSTDKRKALHTFARTMVSLVKLNSVNDISNNNFIDMYNGSHTMYRLHSYCNTWCFRAGDGGILRCRHFWRSHDTTHNDRIDTCYSISHLGCGRQSHRKVIVKIKEDVS